MQIHSPAQLSYDWHGSPMHPFQDAQPAYEAAICCVYVMPGVDVFPFELPPLTGGAGDGVGFKTAVTSVVGVGGEETAGFKAAFSCTGTTGAGEGAGDGEGDGEAAGVTSALIC